VNSSREREVSANIVTEPKRPSSPNLDSAAGPYASLLPTRFREFSNSYV
jgi:hypothetical protein